MCLLGVVAPATEGSHFPLCHNLATKGAGTCSHDHFFAMLQSDVPSAALSYAM